MIPADLLARANSLLSRRVPFVIATVVRVERPASAKPGDRALLLPDGGIEGFAGGECAESTVRRHGLRQLAAGQSALLRIVPPGGQEASSADGVIIAANPCLSGGTIEIFLEVISPPVLVQVFGDSPIAHALEALGAAMGWDVRRAADPATPIADDTAAVVVASHGGDAEKVLAPALRAMVPYVGLVASRRRGSAVIAGLGLTPQQRARVHTPAGLDIAARGPGEIAVSILAEIIASRVSGTAGQVHEAAGRPPPADGGQPADGGEASGGPQVATATTEAVDPVCGMAVAIANGSLRADHDGTTWYFCGSGCRDAFAADPERYRV